MTNIEMVGNYSLTYSFKIIDQRTGRQPSRLEALVGRDIFWLSRVLCCTIIVDQPFAIHTRWLNLADNSRPTTNNHALNRGNSL